MKIRLKPQTLGPKCTLITHEFRYVKIYGVIHSKAHKGLALRKGQVLNLSKA